MQARVWSPRKTEWALRLLIFLLALGCGLWGIDWGLPGADRVALLGEDTAALRAQIEPDSRTERLVYIHEHETSSVDLARAYRRYFLYSHHPDEMLTLMGLARMNPARLDFHPRQFQYGGLFTYPIGGLLWLGGKLGLLTVTTDLNVYLEEPRLFARFYVVGRLYVVLFYAATALLVFQLARRMGGGCRSAFVAALLFALSPAAVVFSHEMKPHAAAPFFVLLMFYCLWRLLEENQVRWLWYASLACGGATAMVYANEIFVLAPVACVLFVQGSTLGERVGRTALCCGIVAAVYLICNPYVLLDLPTLREEIRLIRIRYEPGFHLSGLGGFLHLLAAGAVGLPTALLSVWGLFQLVRRRLPWAMLVLGMVVLYGTLLLYQLGAQAGSAKMARLLCPLLPLWAVLAAAGLETMARQRAAHFLLAAVAVGWTAFVSVPYLQGFHRDATADNTRLRAGRWINEHIPAGSSIRVPCSPAPYKCPPFAFGRYGLRCDPASPAEYEIAVGDTVEDASRAVVWRTSSRRRPTPLSFADMTVGVYRTEAK